MSTVQVKIEINAPPQKVWDIVMDPSSLERWVTIHKRLKEVSGGRLAEGSTMEQVLALRGVSFSVHWTLVELDPPHEAVWDGRGPAHSRAKITYRLQGDESGPTQFDYTNEFSPPGGALGKVASRVIVGAASEREAANSLNRLKALVEDG